MVKKSKQPPMARRAQPTALERAYAAKLLAIVAKMRAPVDRALRRLAKLDEQKQDAKKDNGRNVKQVRRAMAGVQLEFDTIVKEARPGLIAQGVDSRVSAFVIKAVNKQIEAPFRGTVTLPTSEIAEHKSFVNANVRLIGSIKQRLLKQVEGVVADAWVNGKTTDELADLVEERFGVTESRARLIARDQVGKLTADVTEQRHKELGITSYNWSTSRDERVREAHAEREGQRFDYDDPPEGGHPGQDYQCRCEAIPVIADIDFPEADA